MEIKETINILYDFATNVNSDYIYDAHGFDYPLISDCIEDLLDYITNLQEENERLKTMIRTSNIMEYFKGHDVLQRGDE